jgi:hypothetical protein
MSLGLALVSKASLSGCRHGARISSAGVKNAVAGSAPPPWTPGRPDCQYTCPRKHRPGPAWPNRAFDVASRVRVQETYTPAGQNSRGGRHGR